MRVHTLVNFTNPTPYSATIPFIDFLILYNNTAVAHLTARNQSIVTGNNSHVPFELFWCPLSLSGIDGIDAGRTLFSSYISGKYLTWIEVQMEIMLTPPYVQASTQLSQSKLTVIRFHHSQIWAKHYHCSISQLLSPDYLSQALQPEATKVISRTSSKTQRYSTFSSKHLKSAQAY